MKAVYALLLASTLVVPHVVPARGADTTTQPGAVQQDQTQVRPDRQLRRMPWLKSLSTSKGTKIDFLDPKFQVPGPFLAEHMISQDRGSWIASSFVVPTVSSPSATD
jgi:hypothetical protein